MWNFKCLTRVWQQTTRTQTLHFLVGSCSVKLKLPDWSNIIIIIITSKWNRTVKWLTLLSLSRRSIAVFLLQDPANHSLSCNMTQRRQQTILPDYLFSFSFGCRLMTYLQPALFGRLHTTRGGLEKRWKACHVNRGMIWITLNKESQQRPNDHSRHELSHFVVLKQCELTSCLSFCHRRIEKAGIKTHKKKLIIKPPKMSVWFGDLMQFITLKEIKYWLRGSRNKFFPAWDLVLTY